MNGARNHGVPCDTRSRVSTMLIENAQRALSLPAATRRNLLRHGLIVGILACSAVLQACTTVSPGQRFVQRSYEIGVERSASLGEDIFSVRRGQRYEASVFVGLLFGGTVKDTWEQDIEEHQLLFEGAEGTALKCTYRHSQIPAAAIAINSRRNPNVRSPYEGVSGGTANNTIRPMQIDIAGADGRKLSYAGVDVEILELTPKQIRFRVLSDSFGDGDPPPMGDAAGPVP